MPNAKTGTVTFEVSKAVNELKAGKIDFRVEAPQTCSKNIIFKQKRSTYNILGGI